MWLKRERGKESSEVREVGRCQTDGEVRTVSFCSKMREN